MVVKFDALDRLEKPTIALCNPGCVYRNGRLSRSVGILGDTEAEELILNFNAPSELNFRINRISRDDATVDGYTQYLYRKVQNRRLLFLDDIGFFVITGVEDRYEDGIYSKDVSAKSADIELQQKGIPYIEDGTYPLYSDTSPDGILNRVAAVLPLWDVYYVDPDLREKYRTFEDVDATLNCLSFLLDNVQDAYECIVLFDTVHRRISVYDQANYIKNTDIYVTKDNVVNTLEISENADDLYTALRVTGQDELTISAVNPIGTNVIYNFNYYLDWMSPELSAKVERWQKETSAAERKYRELSRMFYMNEDNIYREETEIERLEGQKTLYSRCRENIIAENGVSHVDEYNRSITDTGGAPLYIYGYYGTVVWDVGNEETGFWQRNDDETYTYSGKIAADPDAIYIDVGNMYGELNRYRYNQAEDRYEMIYKNSVEGYYGTVIWEQTGEVETCFWNTKNPTEAVDAHRMNPYTGRIAKRTETLYRDLNARNAEEWSNANSYREDDHVTYNSLLYRCIKATDPVLPENTPDTDDSHWEQTAGVYSYNSADGSFTYFPDGYTDFSNENEISVLLTKIDALLAQCDEGIAAAKKKLNDTYEDGSPLYKRRETYSSGVNDIRNRLSITKTGDYAGYFSPDEYEELRHYIFEGSYTDEYITITDGMNYYEKFNQMEALYKRGKETLSRASSPTQEFTVEAESFIFDKAFRHQSEQLETGCLINVELCDGDIAALFLTSITVNYDDYDISLKFGNRYNRFDTKALFEDVLGNISKSANTLNYIKDVVQPVKDGKITQIQNALIDSRNITMGNALSSRAEEVVIDGTGYTGKIKTDDGGYDDRQIKITGRNIVFTEDAWHSCSAAIGEIEVNGKTFYGINAKAIVGDMLMGEGLVIKDENGNEVFRVIGRKFEQIGSEDGDGVFNVDHVKTSTGFTFDKDGLRVTREGTEIENKIDNTGMYVKRSGADVLTANNIGVSAINLTAREYLTIGTNSMFADYDDGTDPDDTDHTKRTACYYIGG